jgi:hypothetical protein
MWSEGKVVALRDVWHGRVWRAVPGIVVRDDDAETAIWIPPGTENAYPVDGDGREVRLSRDGVRWARRTTGVGMLAVIRTGEPWSVWHYWDAEGSPDHWYVNFEAQLGRRGSNLDYRDHKLDLIAFPDGSTRLKDEDELDEAAALGLLDADAVRADAERALRDPPWPTGWEGFRPDAAWGVPALPENWAAL